MLNVFRLLTMIGFCLLLSQAVRAQTLAAPPSHMTQAQAIEAASAFCRSIGVAVQAPANAVYPAPDLLKNPPHYWLPRWQVTLAPQIEVEVVDATGKISSFSNLGLSNLFSDEPAGEAISEAEAITRAQSLLKASGQVSELGVPKASLEQYSSKPMMASHRWAITWERLYQGVPYKDEGVVVLLQAETGEPIGLGVNFRSAPLAAAASASPNTAATRALPDAVGIASSWVKTLNLPPMTFRIVETLIVQPNKFWLSEGQKEQKVPVPVRLAKIVTFSAGSDLLQVWVDAKTGEVIGGAAIGTLGLPSKKPVHPHPETKSPKKSSAAK